MTFRNLIQSNHYRLPLAASCLILALVGCSSMPPPVAQMASAETALNAAINKDAEQHAPVAMDRAKQKFARAKDAMGKEDYQQAKKLAEEAQADAELAQALVDQAHAQPAVKELEAGVKALRNEIERADKR